MCKRRQDEGVRDQDASDEEGGGGEHKGEIPYQNTCHRGALCQGVHSPRARQDQVPRPSGAHYVAVRYHNKEPHAAPQHDVLLPPGEQQVLGVPVEDALRGVQGVP